MKFLNLINPKSNKFDIIPSHFYNSSLSKVKIPNPSSTFTSIFTIMQQQQMQINFSGQTSVHFPQILQAKLKCRYF